MRRRETADWLAVDLLSELLEAALHATLARRSLYPAAVFESYRQYGVSLQRAVEPSVCAYVASFVTALRPWLRAGTLHSVDLLVLSSDAQRQLERHSFSLGLLGAAASVSPPPAREAADPAGLAALERQCAELLLRPLPRVTTTNKKVVERASENLRATGSGERRTKRPDSMNPQYKHLLRSH